MPWYLTVPGALGAFVVTGYARLGFWYRRSAPAAAAQISEAFAREKEQQKVKSHA